MLILAYFSIGAVYAAKVTSEELKRRLESAATMGDYLGVAMAYVGPDGWNFIIAFIVVAAVMYMGSGMVAKFSNGSDEMKTGLKVFSVASGLAAAYYVFVNKINLIEYLGSWSLLLLIMIGALFFMSFASSASEGKANIGAIGAGMMFFGIALAYLLKGKVAGWATTIGVILIIFGFIIFIIGVGMTVSGWFKPKPERGETGAVAEEKGAIHDLEDAEKEIKETEKGARVVQKLEGIERGTDAQGQALIAAAQQAAQQGYWQKVEDNLDKLLKRVAPKNKRVRARILSRLIALVKELESIKTNFSNASTHIKKEEGRLAELLALPLGQEKLAEISKQLGESRKLSAEVDRLRNNVEQLERNAQQIRGYEQRTRKFENEFEQAIKGAMDSIKNNSPDVNKINGAFNADAALRRWDAALFAMDRAYLARIHETTGTLNHVIAESRNLLKQEGTVLRKTKKKR